MCLLARREHGALLQDVPLRNDRFAEADLRGGSTGREFAMASLQCHAQPLLQNRGRRRTLAKTLTSGSVESERKRNGTADGIRGPR